MPENTAEHKIPIILCADDYALSVGISDAILKLITAKRLSATSCMTDSVHWPELGKALMPFKGQIDIGLHFDLTELSPEARPLKKVLVDAQLRRLNQQHIEDIFRRQLNAFEAVMGSPPDYIDGHQHVHQFPVIRDALIAVWLQRFNTTINKPYIRIPSNGFFGSIKEIIITLTGSFGLKRLLRKNVIPHNSAFAGIYDFGAKKHSQNTPNGLQKILKNSFKNPKKNTLIMCHPGLSDSTYSDPISGARTAEHAYLMSDDFTNLCTQHNIKLSRFCR